MTTTPLRWRWDQHGGTKDVVLDGEIVVVTDTTAMPRQQTLSLSEAFGGSGRRLFVPEPAMLAEILRALAARLAGRTPARPLEAQRVAFWQHLRADGVAPRRFEWPWARGGHREPVACSLELTGVVAHGASPHVEQCWQMLDDVLFHGPLQPGIPAAVRAALVAHVLEAVAPAASLGPDDAFPAIDHAAIAARSWSWNPQHDGEEGATIGGASVVIGYQFGHDMGWSEYPVERVLTGAPDVHVGAPDEIGAELRAALSPPTRS